MGEFNRLEGALGELHKTLSQKILMELRNLNKGQKKEFVQTIGTDFGFSKTVIKPLKNHTEMFNFEEYLHHEISMLMILSLLKNAEVISPAQNQLFTNMQSKFTNLLCYEHVATTNGVIKNTPYEINTQITDIIVEVITHYADILKNKIIRPNSKLINGEIYPSERDISARKKTIEANIEYATSTWFTEGDRFGLAANGALVIPATDSITFTGESLVDATKTNTTSLAILNKQKRDLEQQEISLELITQKLQTIQDMVTINIRYSKPLKRYVVYQKLSDSVDLSTLHPDSQTYIEAEEILANQVGFFANKLGNIGGYYNDYNKYKKLKTLEENARYLINCDIPKKGVLARTDPHQELRSLQENLKASRASYQHQYRAVKDNGTHNTSERAVCKSLENLINQLNTNYSHYLQIFLGQDEAVTVSQLFPKLCELIQKDEKNSEKNQGDVTH